VRFKAKIRGLSRTPGAKPGEAADMAILVSPFSMANDRYGTPRMVFHEGYVSVELGPEWFVKDQTTKLHVNDYVEITGSRMSMNGRPAIIAQSVRHGHNVLALHRLSGEPYWYALQSQPSDNGASAANDAAAETFPPQTYTPPANQNQGNQVGAALIYGDAFPLFGGFRSDMQPMQPIGHPLVILGNYGYGGPLFFRF
jgi:hypothetical protein